MPGSLVTIERRVPVRRLKRVDLPTLGRPTITRDGAFFVMKVSGRIQPRNSGSQVQPSTVTHLERKSEGGPPWRARLLLWPWCWRAGGASDPRVSRHIKLGQHRTTNPRADLRAGSSSNLRKM